MQSVRLASTSPTAPEILTTAPRALAALVGVSTLVLALVAGSAPAQTHGGFVATLGVDTVHIERFARAGNTLSGTIIARTPAFRVLKWSMNVDAAGKPTRYEVHATDAKGADVLNGTSGSFAYANDSIARDAYRNGTAETTHIAAPNGAYPSPSLPYIGVSYLMYERAFADVRERAARTNDSSLYWLTMLAQVPALQKQHIWLVGADSAEMNYFNVARSGYKFNAKGELIRADWTGTTYRYRIQRVNDVDVDALAKKWAQVELNGGGIGPTSPRDSVKGMLGGAAFTFDYSRPAARGRVLWGDVIPLGKVWRLGADMATHFSTSADLKIGETAVPAGRYTLWMLPTESQTLLIVSSAVNVFGTQYNPSKDFARIPMQKGKAASVSERLTLDISDGTLHVRWGDIIWSVPVIAGK